MTDDARRAAWRVLAGGAITATLARIAWAGAVQLSPDEAYYWSWGRQPALSYTDHPPLVGWLMALVPEGLGRASEVWVRLPAIASGALVVPLVYALARSVGASRPASVMATLAGMLSLMACAGAVIVTPDSPLIVLWTLGLLLAVKLARGGSPWLLPAACAAAGAACLAKLPGVLLLPGIAAALVARRRGACGMGLPAALSALALVGAAAVLVVGEAGRSGGPASFQLARLSGAALRPLGPLEVILAMAGLAGVLPLAGAAGTWLEGGSREGRVVLAWTLWPPVAACAILAALLHVEANWTAVAFPSLFAGWALVVDRVSARRRALGLAAGGAAVLVNLAAAVLVHLHAAGVLAPGLVGRGPAARLHGWREIAGVVAATSPGRMVTDDYGLAASLSYYGRGLLDVSLDRRAAGGGEPILVWTVEDGRLGLVRRIEGLAGPGVIRIRAAAP